MSERIEFYLKGRDRLPEPFHLRGFGLPNVYLLNGVSIENDPEYGSLVTIDDLNGLSRAIGLSIIEKRSPMTGAEFRFLRQQMQLTQAKLATYMNVSAQTVANYEKGKTSLGAAEAAMRSLYAIVALPPDAQVRLLKNSVAAADHRGRRIPDAPRRKIAGHWREQLAA